LLNGALPLLTPGRFLPRTPSRNSH
jgi:hypothetical protein